MRRSAIVTITGRHLGFARRETSSVPPGVRVALCALCSILTLLALPGNAWSGGAKGITLKAIVSKSDDAVGIAIRVTAGPKTACSGTAKRRDGKVTLDALTTGDGGEGQWSWQIAPGVPHGTWRADVRCSSTSSSVRRHSIVFQASGGGGRRQRVRRVYVSKTLHHDAIGTRAAGGNGAVGDSLYPYGQCTWYVATRRPELPFLGDAWEWVGAAKRAKPPFPTAQTPVRGAIAVFQPSQHDAGKYGHVAYVEAVDGDQITISEANYGAFKPGHRRQIPWRGLNFIYPLPTPPAPPVSAPVQAPSPPVFTTSLISGATGVPGASSNNDASGKAVSADARFVAFDSTASNLDPADTDLGQDVFLRDAQGGSTTLVSRAGDTAAGPGAKGDGPSSNPDVSSDGRYLAFVSRASNLAPADHDSTADVFVRDTRDGTTTLVSRASSAGAKGDRDSSNPALSGDGRYVAFVSEASNLVAGDTNAKADVFLHDMQTDTTVLVSRSSASSGNGDSSDPAISRDGRFVAFESAASNLVAGDTATMDVFVRDTQADITTLVSRSSTAGAGAGNEIGNAESADPDISGDGRYVTFDSRASNLDPADRDQVRDVFVRDRRSDTTTLVSRATGASGTQANSESANPAISDDGRNVGFDSAATNLDRADSDDNRDVYERDIQANVTTLVSRATGGSGAQGNQDAFTPAISSGGRTVAFTSYATNLDPADSDTGADVFVHDSVVDTTTLVSRATGTVGLKDASDHPAMSSDGRYVAFSSQTSKLDPADHDKVSDIFVRDLQAGTTTLVSRTSSERGDAKGDGDSWGPAISGDGRYVAFFSYATNLDPADGDPTPDVFVRDVQAGTTTLVSRASDQAGGAKGDGDSLAPAISNDGRYVSFDSVATNLDPADTDGTRDVFVRDVQAGSTTLVSRADGPSGAKGGDVSKGPAISGDGRLVSFTSSATNLDPNDHDTGWDVFVRDVQAGTTTLVSRASTQSGGAKGNSDSIGSAISGNGRCVTFTSGASNLDPGDGDTTWDVFARDLQTGATTLVSRASDAGGGAKGNGDSLISAITASGRYVVFESVASNLDPGDGDTAEDIFVRDTQTGTTTMASRATGSPGVKGDGGSRTPDISDSGRYVAFASAASNLDPGGDSVLDVFVRDVLGDPATTPSSPPRPAGADSSPPHVKLSGRTTQKLGTRVSITVACPDETCRVVATGTVFVAKGRSRKPHGYPLKATSKTLLTGEKATLKLTIPVKTRRIVKRALTAGRAVAAKLTVTVSDSAGNPRTLLREIELKR
jgi:surface antigen